MKEFLSDLVAEFGDAEYAHSYMESHSVSRIAAQIYALRKQRGWSQADLAQRAGIAQERISKIESADFDSLTMKTLQKFARAFDVNVHVAFTSFSDGIIDVAKLDPAKLQVCSREADLGHFKSYNETSIWRSHGINIPLQTTTTAAVGPSVVSPASVGAWQTLPPVRVACDG